VDHYQNHQNHHHAHHGAQMHLVQVGDGSMSMTDDNDDNDERYCIYFLSLHL
jgi:hypothetical protein